MGLFNDEYSKRIDAMSEDDLFRQSPVAWAMRYAGTTDHDIMVALLRENLELKRQYMTYVETFCAHTIITPPDCPASSGRSTEAPSPSGS